MQLSHKIALCPTPEQANYFKRACGTARRVWNWALAEWKRQYAAGQKPNAMALKKQFNAIKYRDAQWLDEGGQPWLRDIHRDAHPQPLAHLAKAWSRFFAQVKAGKSAHAPQFKKKGRCRDSFYVANDKFSVDGMGIRLPKIGQVAMTKALRLEGKICGATVSRSADTWFVAIQVEVPDTQFYRARTAHGITGVDLGIKAVATLSSGESIQGPKPLKAALHRLKIRARRISRKIEAAKVQAGFAPNDKLARVISDMGFGMFSTQRQYKAKRFATRLVIADRWYPSSRLCSACDWKNEALTLKDRQWTCPHCGSHHDRDHNAALNLQRLATETALPVASPTGNGGATAETVSAIAGKVTPVRYECSPQDTSGQEKNRVYIHTPS